MDVAEHGLKRRARRREGRDTSSGRGLEAPPDGDDWLLCLERKDG